MAKSDWLNPARRERGTAAILKRANWAVREYINGDEVEILQLCQQLFNITIAPEEWRWRMFQNPAGQTISRVAYLKDSGRIVGHLAGMPLDLKVGNHSRKIFFLVDSVVAPAHQGRGIHAVLTMDISKTASNQWAGILAGLPNTEAYGPNLKLGGTQILTMSVYLKVLNWSATIRAGLRSTFVARAAGRGARCLPRRKPVRERESLFTLREVRRFNGSVDELWKRVSPTVPVCARRTSDVLNWRYFERPNSDYSIFSIAEENHWRGYIVVRCLNKWGLQLGTIVDLFFDAEYPAAGKLLVHHAENHLRESGADILWGLFACQPVHAKILRQSGLFRAPHISGVRQFHLVADFVSADHSRPDLYARDGARLRQGDQWFLSLGDTDLA